MKIERILNNSLHVNLQMMDGISYTGKVYGADVDVSLDYQEQFILGKQEPVNILEATRWTVVLEGVGDLIEKDRVVETYKKIYTAIEWRCEWCGSVQPSHRMACGQCGASRSFLYDLMKFSLESWR